MALAKIRMAITLNLKHPNVVHVGFCTRNGIAVLGRYLLFLGQLGSVEMLLIWGYSGFRRRYLEAHRTS